VYTSEIVVKDTLICIGLSNLSKAHQLDTSIFLRN